jgi:hypothetical protein
MQFLFNSETNHTKSFKSQNIKINKYKILYIFKKEINGYKTINNNLK